VAFVACSRVYFYSCLPLGLASILFPYVFPSKALHTSLLSLICATCLAYHILIYLITLIPSVIKIVKLLCTQSSPFPSYPVPLGQNIFLSTIFTNTFSPCSFLNVRDHVSHPYKTLDRIVVLCVKICIFLGSILEQK